MSTETKKRQIVTAEDIARAGNGTECIYVQPNAIITPSARDAATKLNLRIEERRGDAPPPKPSAFSVSEACETHTPATEEGPTLPDIRERDLFGCIPFPAAQDPVALSRLRQAGPARICLDRTGPRYKTLSLLQFQADHAAAVDAAFTDVSQTFLEKERLAAFKTLCASRQEYLQRPDLGRTLAPEQVAGLVKLTGKSPRVLIYYADGLSSTALETNGPDTYHSMVAGLQRHGITPPPPFFVRWARVPSQDCISEATGAEVVCTLIGERPGLVSSESLSVYFSYKATVDMPEARRTVISNIHKGGTPAVEAGAYIADIVKLMLDKKASGTDLPL